MTKPFTIRGIPGTFIEPRIKAIRFRRIHHEAGELEGVDARWYLAGIEDGMLRVCVGHEPCGKGGSLLWHMSISHGATPQFRYPTWDEIRWARFQLVPAGVHMAMLMPGKIDMYVNTDDYTMHLWEVDEELVK